MFPAPPFLKNSTFENKYPNNSISIIEIKDEMQYYKIEANYIFKKCLQNKTVLSAALDRNSNFTGTTAVDIIFNNDEAYQLYTFRQITYGKKIASYYKSKIVKLSGKKIHKVKSPPPKKIKKGRSKENSFLKAFDLIPKIHRPLFDPPCPWLEKRLYVDDLCGEGTQWEDIAVAVRDNLVNLANDLCIFYTSQSHIILTIIKVEAYNIVRLLALPSIQEYNSRLSKQLLQNLFKLINLEINDNAVPFQEMRDVSKDLIWNYYRFPSPHARSLKDIMRDTPKVLYYSSWISDELIPGINKQKIDPRFVKIERAFQCKVIFRRNLAALSPEATHKINETLMELYFDYNRGQFLLAIANINKLIKSHESSVYRDLRSYQTMVSCVSKEFFCCEEIAALIEREYVMDDMSYHFIQLMHWLKSHRIAHYVFG